MEREEREGASKGWREGCRMQQREGLEGEGERRRLGGGQREGERAREEESGGLPPYADTQTDRSMLRADTGNSY